MLYGSDSRPKLRWPLDVQHVQNDGQHFVVLRDSSGVAPNSALVPAALIAIISRFDGTATISEIAESGRAYGVTVELVSSIAADLDHFSLLDTEETRRRWDSIRADWAALDIREAALAGGAYSANPDELLRELERYISTHGGAAFICPESEQIVGIMAPHIDYSRGWRAYGAGYAALEQAGRPDVVVLLGTAHQPGSAIYHLTKKDFATPLGMLPCARELVDELASAYGPEQAFRDEILHRREHSLELQLPFLMHRFGNGDRPRIVPILVGSFHQFVTEEIVPEESVEVAQFVGALAELLRRLREAGKEALLYCGVDLAHMGLHFGDQERVSDGGLALLEARDRLLLQSLMEGNERKFFQHIAEDRDRRRICGFPAVYTALAALRGSGVTPRGHLIDYRQAVDPATDCIVTFASLCWSTPVAGPSMGRG